MTTYTVTPLTSYRRFLSYAERDGRVTEDYRGAVQAIADVLDMRGGIYVHGTVAIAYHTNGMVSGCHDCGGHRIATVIDNGWR